MFILLLFLLSWLVGTTAISPIQATYVVKNAHIQSLTMKMAIISITFDEELYLASSFHLSCSEDCPVPLCACDYSRCNNLSACCDQSLCTESWASLPEDKPIQGSVGFHHYNHYRFYTSECQVVKVKLISEGGNPYLLVGYTAPPTREKYDYIAPEWNAGIEKILCPQDHNGTIFLSVFAGGDMLESPNNATYTLWVTRGERYETQTTSSHLATGASEYYDFSPQGNNISLLLKSSQGTNMDMFVSLGEDEPGLNCFDYYSGLVGDDRLDIILPHPTKVRVRVEAKVGGNYSLSLTEEGFYFFPLANVPPYGGTFDLVGTSRLRTPGNSLLNCTNWNVDCREYFPVWSTDSPNPLWPRPAAYANDLGFAFSFGGQVNAGFRPNIYTVAVMLEYSNTDPLLQPSQRFLMKESDLENSTIEFLGRLTDKWGHPIAAIAPLRLTKSMVLCNRTRFELVRVQMEKAVALLGDVSNIKNVYSLIYTIGVYSFLDEWYGCQAYVDNLIAFDTNLTTASDKSCSQLPGTSLFDNQPCCSTYSQFNAYCEIHNTTRISMVPIREVEGLETICRHEGCATSYLRNYIDALASSEKCDAPVVQPYPALFAATAGCKFSILYRTCHKDSDCNYTTGSYRCNLKDRKCLIPLDDLEYAYVACAVASLDELSLTVLRQLFNITGEKNSSEFITQLRDANRKPNCIDERTIFNPAVGTHVTPRGRNPDCLPALGCPPLICEDTLCKILTGHRASSCANTCNAEWERVASEAEKCQSSGSCNWFDCTGLSSETCETRCQTGSSFCGLCENGQDCISFPVAQEDCHNTSVCYLPNNTVVVGMGNEACGQVGACSVDCGQTCSCSNMSIENCHSPCQVVPRSCSQQECLEGGICSDFTGCVFPFPYQRQAINYDLTCAYGLKYVTIGCLSTSIFQPNVCHSSGGEWRVASSDQNSCLAQLGCFYISNSAFRYMDVDLEACQNHGYIVRPIFTWTPAVWKTGVLRSLSWTPARYAPRYVWRSSLDYFALSSSIFQLAAGAQPAYSYRSQSLCSVGRIITTIPPLVCDCSEESLGHCYANTSIGPTTAVGRPCANIVTTIRGSKHEVLFTKASLGTGCCTATLYYIPSTYLLSGEEPRLSGFGSFHPRPNTSPVKNQKAISVGVVAGDGMKLAHNCLQPHVSVCMNIDGKVATQLYYIPDLAIADADLDTLVPLNLSGISIGAGRICVNITLDNDIMYFPIYRRENWKEYDQSPFETTSTVLIYILAALFALSTIIALFQGAGMIRRRRVTLKDLSVIFLLLFVCIRSIYFFLLVTTVPYNLVIDTLLCDLPTFFYFTSFTIIVLFWALTSGGVRSLMRVTRFKIICLIVNAAMYALFITVVIVYSFTTDVTETSECPEVQPDEVNEKPRRIVSIIYASLLSFISVVIATLFIGYGTNILMRIKKSNSLIKIKKREEKIFAITLFCSLTFLLHCVFILIVICGRYDNEGFNFVGIVVTEWIPTIFILFMFGSRSYGPNTSSSSEGADPSPVELPSESP